jgi:chromosome segregation ATPase
VGQDSSELDKKTKAKVEPNEDIEGDLQVSASAFEALERDFQEVLSDLMEDESLEKFRLEYEKLHRALKKSHEQEKRLVKKCRELNSEILNNQAKIKTALRLSQEDQKTITHIQKEMEKTWKLVYQSQEKEARAKDTIAQLKEEMVNLSKLVERGAGLSLNQENTVKELRQAKEELERQVSEQAMSIAMIETQLLTQHKVQEDLRNERDDALQKIQEARDRIASKENENAREMKRREKIQQELQHARTRLDDKIKDETDLQATVAVDKAHIQELERQLVDARATMEKYLRDYDNLMARSTSVSNDLEHQTGLSKKLQNDIVEFEKEMKLKHVEVSRLRTDKDLLERKLDKEHREMLHYQSMLEESKTPLAVAHAEIDSLKRDLLNAHRHELTLNKTTEKLSKEKDHHLKATERAETRTKEQVDKLEELQRINQGLQNEMQAYKEDVVNLRKAILGLEKDRERLGNEVSEQRSNYMKAEEDLKFKDIQISELKKRVSEWEAKLKQQQQLYEAVRTDRNHYSKGLLESQDEIAELRKKFKIMGHQIEQLKEEIASKDQAIVKEHFEFQRAEKLMEVTKAKLERTNDALASSHDLVKQQENELSNLTSTLRRMDDEAISQRKEYDQVINERDILGTQLIRRNDELALLYEKLRIQHSALKKGEVQYNHRLDDIRLLRVKVQSLVRENAINKGVAPQIDELKKTILQLHRELLQEKTKVTALSEELENPMNVHRWRKLEGSDPATFELIQKIQTLQRRLISKTEEVVEKGLVIQEKEKLFVELKAVMARQPGPEVAEQLAVYQQNLKKKTIQMKAMASELNMYQAQVNEYKYDQERLSREVTELKRKYYVQKRKEKLVEDMEYEGGAAAVSMSKTGPLQLQNEQIVAAKAARTRYTGGGFAIKT